jgi:ParB-like chromosome segregation protein Spo0J
MKRAKLRDLTVNELVHMFADVAVQQDLASLREEIALVNRLFMQMQEVKEELKRRDGDQRGALLRLYDHPNAQVRLTAAKATLAVAPAAARQALQVLRQSKEYPHSADAGMCIWALEQGIFKPT